MYQPCVREHLHAITASTAGLQAQSAPCTGSLIPGAWSAAFRLIAPVVYMHEIALSTQLLGEVIAV